MGSALALQGARTFADSLGRSPDDVLDALAEYERSVPVARGFQQNALKAKPVILGRNALPNLLRNAVVRFVPEFPAEEGTALLPGLSQNEEKAHLSRVKLRGRED